jgi:hypothetical protein
MNGSIGHVEVLGEDPAPLRDFYSAVFGWRVGPVATDDPEQMEYAMVQIGDGPGAISAGIGRRTSGFLPVTFYIQVDDLEAALASVSERGGRTVSPPLRVGPATSIARFADPAGNVIGLVAG